MKTTSSISNTFHPNQASTSLSTGLGSTSTLITDMFGDPYQFFLNLPFGESMAEQRRSGSFNNPYKFNGKELDGETSLYYYGARYYNPRVSNWLSVDPLAEHTMTPYQYMYQNPVKYVDPTGMAAESVDDIIFRDKNGNLIATYYTTEYHEEIYLNNIDIKESINININKVTKKLPDVDVIGVSIGGEFTVAGGANSDLQFAFFLDGKDAGYGAFFYSVQGTLGFSIGGGISAFAGDFTGAKGDSQMTMSDFTGNITSYNASIKFISVNPWWGNNLTL